MTALKEIQERYAQYVESCRELRASAGAFDGFLGLGHDPKKDSSHRIFYQDVERMTELLAAAPAGPEKAEELKEVTEFLLKAERRWAGETLAVWMCAAAQGHALKLIPLLSAQDAGELFAWYDENYPRRQRLPVQDQVYKALRKQSKKGT